MAPGNSTRLGRPRGRRGVQDDERTGDDADLAAGRPDRAEPLVRGAYCTGITIDPRHRHVYVTFGGYGAGNVWMTPTAARPGGTRRLRCRRRRCARSPCTRASRLLYLGTEVGLFASEDGGATWSPTNEGPTNCSVDDLFWMGETLVCVTHGRGMFRIDLSGVS